MNKPIKSRKLLRDNRVVAFSMPANLHKKLIAEARENMTSTSGMLRRILLERYQEEAAYERVGR